MFVGRHLDPTGRPPLCPPPFLPLTAYPVRPPTPKQALQHFPPSLFTLPMYVPLSPSSPPLPIARVRTPASRRSTPCVIWVQAAEVLPASVGRIKTVRAR